MVNADFTDGGVTSLGGLAEAERRVILSYVPAEARAGVGAILSLDDVMAEIVRTTSEPMIGQMRFTWWHDALSKLDGAPAPAHPVLQALAEHTLPRVAGSTLAIVVEGWEELIEFDLLDDALSRYAAARGGTVFDAIACLTDQRASSQTESAGRGWALADLAQHVTDPALRARAEAMAKPLLREAAARRWPRRLRALGAMVHLARRPDSGAGPRIGRALLHRITGF